MNGHPDRVAFALPDLEAVLLAPEGAEALVAAIEALNSAWDPRAASLLLRLVDPEHPHGAVRSALARALPGGATGEPEFSAAVEVLIRLTTDELADVRDWACFGLGQLEADTPAARDALAARLTDDDHDTRSEAVAALAIVRDPRARRGCMDALSGDSDQVAVLTLKTAAELADPALLPGLRRLRAVWAEDDSDELSTSLDVALLRCGDPAVS